jgi:chaperonin GroES
MNFKPLGDRVLIKVKELETQTASGIYIPDNATQEKPTQAEVVAVGSEVKDVKVGDQVIFTKFARSATVTLENIEYLVMETTEILGIMGEIK